MVRKIRQAAKRCKMKAYNGFTPEQRNKAAAWLRSQWAAGRPRPVACCACGQDKGVIDAHAEDYTEPFGNHTDQYPMCIRCHMMLHCRFRSPDVWNDYRAAIRSGVRYAPLFSRSFGPIASQLNGTVPPFTTRCPPARLVLDEIHEALASSTTPDDSQSNTGMIE